MADSTGGRNIYIIRLPFCSLFSLDEQVLCEVSTQLSHQCNPRAHYDPHINSLWYGITERAIKIYIDMCPICLQYSRTPKTEKMNRLKMIISATIGSGVQVDLIDLRRCADNDGY
jgi:hypothetical protein